MKPDLKQYKWTGEEKLWQLLPFVIGDNLEWKNLERMVRFLSSCSDDMGNAAIYLTNTEVALIVWQEPWQAIYKY